MLQKKIFNKYFYIFRTLQWCFNDIFKKTLLKIDPGANFSWNLGPTVKNIKGTLYDDTKSENDLGK